MASTCSPTRSLGLRLAERDVLGAVPEHPPAELAQVLVPGDDRREVVPGERARLARERDVAVREQELRLAHAARVEDQLARARVAGRVLRPDADVELAHRDPPALARPADVDDLRLERQHPAKRRNGLGSRFGHEARREPKVAGGDLEHRPNLSQRSRAPQRCAIQAARSVALVLGHPGRVPRRHRAGLHRLSFDVVDPRLDLLLRLEPDPERRGRTRVTRRAALGDHGLDLCEGHGRGDARSRLLGPQPERECDDACGRDHRDPPHAATRVPAVEEDADECGQERDRDEDEPRLVGTEHEREVAGEHGEQHRQREVVVVHRPVLRLEQRRRVRLALLLHRSDELPVRRDDHEEDVRGHDRPEHHADLEVRGPRREELARTPGGERDEPRPDDRERRLAALPDGPAEDVVDDPRERDPADAERDRLPLVEIGDARVHQADARVEVVEDDEQRESRRATSCTPPT